MEEKWIRAHAAAQFEMPPMLLPDVGGKTVKASVTLGAGGKALRLVLEQRYGGDIVYGNADIGINGNIYPVTVSGQKQFSVHQGEIITTDMVNAPVTAGTEVELWLYIVSAKSTFNATIVPACHAPGDCCGKQFETESVSMEGDFPEMLCGYAGIDVCGCEDSKVIAVIGDSITAMNLWTGPVIEELLKENAKTVLLNMGIAGGRLLRDTNMPSIAGIQMFGESGLSRLDRDAFSIPGISTVAIAMGVNDISLPGGPEGMSPPAEEISTAEELIAGYMSVIKQCRERNLEVIGCTITPFGEYGTGNDRTCQIRNKVNNWIRKSKEFDAVIDFAKVVSRSENPDYYIPEYDSGDHLHPSAAGGKTMAATFLSCILSGK